VNLVFDIFQGIGIASAVGIRPFLPALAVGALAAGDVQIDFSNCSFSFLEKAPFLIAMLVGAFALALVERQLVRRGKMESRPVALTVAAISVVVGALLFAGSLCRGGYVIWPGLIGGALCAIVGVAASRPLLDRVRARLDAEAAAAVPLFAEAVALIGAILSVLAPPCGVILLGLLLWMLWAGRNRGEQKYAGLRILR
jgi:hypothetical protein